MGELSKLPNIGQTLEEKLNRVGIATKDELFTLGSRDTFKGIASIDKEACFNMICALEGAIQGIKWHYLTKETKEDLKKFLNSLETVVDK